MTTVPYTKGEKPLVAKARGESIKFYGMAGRGATAPGGVVLRKVGGFHPYAVHFANTQLGGYHIGEYSETLEAAERDFAARCRQYDRDGELHRAFIRQEREA